MTLNTYTQTGFPPTFLNAYINSELKEFGLIPDGPNPFQPFFPAQSPMNIEDIYNDSVYIKNNPNAIVVMFDRLVRFRPSTFYRHKREQLVYFIYAPDLSKLFDSTRVIIECLDREDAAAQDLNAWISLNDIKDENDNIITPNVMFHNIKVYQADEARDIAELASARTLFLNKLVIEYDYHTIDTLGTSQKYT
jgi:hypothetical protein